MDDALLALVVSVPALLLIAFTVADVLRRRDLGGGRTALWLLIVVLLPVVGTLVYLLGRPLHLGRPVSAVEDARVGRLLDLLDEREAGRLDTADLHAAVRTLVGEGGS